MKTTRTFSLGLLLVGAAASAHARMSIHPASGECVSVELDGTNGIAAAKIEVAKRTVAAIFADIGVSVEMGWASTRGRSESCVEITVAFRTNVESSFHPGALAYAQPYRNDGTQIYVLIDRIFSGPVHKDGALLGHVIAHELGHALEAISRHSSSGIMKATWTEADYCEMNAHPLSFASEDAVLIHAGFAKRKVDGHALSASSR